MADDYGTCPLDVFDDERFDGLSLLQRTTHTMLMVLADDWGRVSGSAWVLARKVGCNRDEMQEAMDLLVDAELLEIYEAPDPETGKAIKVGHLVGFHGYKQHPRRVRDIGERASAKYPDREGVCEAGKHRRKAEAKDAPSVPEPPAKPVAPRRATGARSAQTGARSAQTGAPSAQSSAPSAQTGAQPAHDRAASRAELSGAKPLSPPQGERERAQQHPGEHVASQDPRGSVSSPRGPVGTGPLEGGPSPVQGRHPPITAYDDREPATIGQRRVNGAKVTSPIAIVRPPRPNVFIGASGTEYPEEDLF